MRVTVADVALSMRCTIERETLGTPDAYGQPSAVWDVLHDNIACLYWIADRAAATENIGPNVGFVLAHTMLQLAANVDVRESDRVASVSDFDGNAIAGPMNIDEVRHRITDTVLVLEAIR